MYIATITPRIAAMMTVRTIHRNSTSTITNKHRRDHHPAQFRECQFGERRIRSAAPGGGDLTPPSPDRIIWSDASAQRLFDISDQVISTFDADAQP